MSKKRSIEEQLDQISDILSKRGQVIPIIDDSDDDECPGGSMPDVIPILALRSSVLFPGAITPITVGRDKSIKLIREVEKRGGLIGALLQKVSSVENPDPEDLYTVGTAAKVLKVLEMPNGNLTVILHGLEKFEVREFISVTPFFRATIVPLKDLLPEKESAEMNALVESVKDMALRIIESSPTIPPEASFAIKNIDSRRGLINFVSSNIEFSDADRQSLLETPGLIERARKLVDMLIKEYQLLELKNEIQAKVREEIDQQQREYFLHQQLRTIQEELGGDTEDKEKDTMRERAGAKKWSQEVGDLFEKEMQKLERLNPSMSEYSIQLNYLELLLELPWGEYSKDNLDLKRAKRHLDKDHFGLDDVKDRILEHLAVLKLKGDLKSPILCLYGAPGVGKTSLGKSVAASLKRTFGRIALGGMHDEAEIRGHRRTYIGAMPGRIIQTIRRAGTSNPVIILDEIDKVGASNHGDPASALLEVLDPEQNSTFHDNYLDVEYDLSKVLFIATANNIGNISSALRDRMEMINVSGYLLEEKIEIAIKHLLTKQLEAHGVPAAQLKMGRKVMEKIISEYTRESGVRALDKLLAKVARSRAKAIGMEETFSATLTEADVESILGVPRFSKDKQETAEQVGIVTGLAWTEVGGEILYVEASLSRGKGALIITGNLGEVMKESASIALGWVKANAEKLGIDYKKLEENDLHIHVPEGAIPKDGPSAGITMVTAITSAFTGHQVRSKIAMTGETTLRGKVLPVGGVKEKILAAKRAGVTDILLSLENKKDILDIKSEYVKGLTFHYVEKLEDVLSLALVQ